MRRSVLALLLVPIAAGPVEADTRIVVDGRGDDSAGIAPAYVDPDGPAGSSGIDLRELWITNDERYVFIRFRLAAALGLQAGNRLTLYVDADGRSTTGTERHGIGAEMSWIFGARSGSLSGRASHPTGMAARSPTCCRGTPTRP